MRLTRLVALAVAGSVCTLLSAAAGPALAGTADPDSVPVARCTAHAGTIVAVDFAHWGGPVVRGCALHQHTGDGLLHAVGFTTAGDAHDGAAFVCRLGDRAFRGGAQYPTPREDDCVLTPPTTGYWSYWVAAAGARRWAYSDLGPMGAPARAGEIQLWVYGATNVAGTAGSGVPRFAPAALRATGGAATAGPGGPRLVAALATPTRSGPGSATGVVIGACLVLALGAAAAVTTRRRRRRTG